MQLILSLMLAAYCFVVHFGMVFRFGSGEGGFGLPTVLAVMLIFSGLFEAPRRIRNTPIFLSITALFAWVIFSSALAPTGILGAYLSLAKKFLYLMLAVSVASWQFDSKRLKIVSMGIALGLLVSGGLTIVDHMGWAKIPMCNEVVKGSEIEGQASHIEQAGGFFPRRTSMAAYFSLSVTYVSILALNRAGLLPKLFYGAISLCGMVTIMLTHNRSALVAVVGAVVAYVMFSNLLSMARRIQIFFMGTVLLFGMIAVMVIFLPDQFAVYKDKFSPYVSDEQKLDSTLSDRGDSARIVIAMYVFESLSTNPFGNGFTKLPVKDEGRSTHNSLITLVWAGGFFTLIWFIPFLLSLWKSVYSKVQIGPDQATYFDALRFSMLAFLAHNMAHDSIGTGLFWAMLAMVVGVREHSAAALAYFDWQRFYGQPMGRPLSTT